MYNIFEAEKLKVHIIIVPHNILSKFNMLGMNLKKLKKKKIYKHADKQLQLYLFKFKKIFFIK